jgi:eukaryotic-like serine/threonine-protein kinase
VHRDVKPANLLLDGDDNVHVSDFGIASTTGDDTITVPGTVLGTAGYLSPEQARGEPATAASDRYALGVVAFELLTGRRPFSGDTPTTEAFAHIHADVPSAVAVDPTLPAGIDEVFRRALAKDPDERPASALQLVAELREALAAEEPPATLVLPKPPTRRVVHRSRRMSKGALVAVLVTALLVAGFVVAALVAAGGDGSPNTARQPQSRGATSTASTTTETTEPTTTRIADAIALHADGYALSQAGDYAEALPLLRAAVVGLSGFGLLDRSERIQGHRDEIDELRRQWEARCASEEQGDEGESPGKSRGKKKGQSGDD